METRKALTLKINGDTIRALESYEGGFWVYWTNAWEKIYDWEKAGFVKAKHYLNCYNHTSFYLTPKGLDLAEPTVYS